MSQQKPPRWEAILRPQNTQSEAAGGEDGPRLEAKLVEIARSTRVYGELWVRNAQNVYGSNFNNQEYLMLVILYIEHLFFDIFFGNTTQLWKLALHGRGTYE